MSLLHSNQYLFDKIRDFFCESSNFCIFSPYIKSDVLLRLLKDAKNRCTNIITTWKPQDIALGASDIEVYKICKKFDIGLLVNNRIHLKAYIRNDFSSCIVTSSNVSARGLALTKMYNYELGAIVENLDVSDKIYFDKIIEESKDVTQSYYDQVKAQAEKLVLTKEMPEQFEIKKTPSDKGFLLTALPMSDGFDVLFDIYNGNRSYSDDVVRSAEHDVRLYGLAVGENETSFQKRLKSSFFKHPFIIKFLKYNGDGRHFGDLTHWLHNTCTTVPTPRRFVIKDALKRLFVFVVELSDGKYVIDVPGEHSELLKKVK